MESNCTMYQRFRIVCVVIMVVCVSICNIQIYETFAESVEIQSPTVIVSEGKKKSPTDVENKPETDSTSAVDPAWEAPSPKTETTSDSKTTLYLGLGAAAAAALAIGLAAGGGGGGGGGVSIAPPTNPSEPPVGADLAGDWRGILQLVNGQREPITAVVTQNGSQVQITTSSSQSYGQSFSGTIRASGHMLMYDQTTGEDWTTFKGPASNNRIPLYDYVNNFTDLDVLILKR